jgi:hypothetical protein
MDVSPKEIRDKINGPWEKNEIKIAEGNIKYPLPRYKFGDFGEPFPANTPEGGNSLSDPVEGGLKKDSEKSRVDLIDAEFLEGLGDVLRFGANKYTAHNWRSGIRFSRLLGAIFRHLVALLKGEDIDKESGLGHVFHLACSCMFLSWHLKHRPDLDDRYKESDPK